MPRNRGEDVRRPGLSRSSSSGHLTSWMHHPAITDGSKQNGHRQVDAEDTGTQVGVLHRDRMTRAEGDGIECTTVFAQSLLTLGASVDIVKYDLRNAASGKRSQVIDVYNPRGGDCS